jgi:hypothetical protein
MVRFRFRSFSVRFYGRSFPDSSFLPQDKVSEFAAMTPQQLLRETQRAAGDENLTNWHDTLISSGKELKTLEEACHQAVVAPFSLIIPSPAIDRSACTTEDNAGT